MSTSTPQASKPVAVATPTETPELVVAKQSFIQRRIVTPIKNHPKIALAVLGGLALVGGAAFVSKNDNAEATTSTPDDSIEIREFDGGYTVLDTTHDSYVPLTEQ